MKRYVLLVSIALACFFGCSRESKLSKDTSDSSSQSTNENKPAQTQESPFKQEPESEGKWVTTAIETGVFGPDGKQRRWVKITAGRPIRLAKGEWVTLQGKKYTGRERARSEVRLEGGQINAYNADVTDN
jgi:hypothetical protein